jgi:U4/U6.U5 tri-snRNP component SNU23
MPPKEGDTQRREWNKEEYRQKAQERQQQQKHKKHDIKIDEKDLKLAQARTQELNLGKDINKTYILTAADEELGVGFYCRDCNLSYKDNMGYLDHINSPQRTNSLTRSENDRGIY